MGSDVQGPELVSTRSRDINQPHLSRQALTGMVVIPSASNRHGTTTLSNGVCWHISVEYGKKTMVGCSENAMCQDNEGDERE
jgi:hypothetical protein